MGDVFEAMNRAQREREKASGQGSKPEDAAPQPTGAEQEQASGEQKPEQPGLPLDQVQAQPIEFEPEPADGATVAGGGEKDGERKPSQAGDIVSRASRRAQAEAHSQSMESITTAPSRGEADLNGYAREVVVHHDRGGVITEQYRAIRTQIVARSRNRKVQIHAVTSSVPEEGKSVTTANLGVAFSELKDQRTLLLEADLRKPSFEHLFQRECRSGLLQYLRGEVKDLNEILYSTVYENMQFMPAGGYSMDQSTELLSSQRMATLLDRLRDEYDHIFIDTPPVVTVTDPCIVGAQADQTLLVVRLNRTPSDAIERAKRLLRAANCELAGVILTHLHHDTPRYRYRYDRYYYSAKK